MKACFVTATGTGVGKTLVSATLCYQLTAKGRSVRAQKPIESGAVDLASSDAGLLLRSLGCEINPAAIAAISPWRFEAPLSPDMAASREGREIDFEALIAHGRAQLMNGADHVLIEGVGGALVPLDACHTVMDWIGALDVPALLVAGSYLGTISHTLATFEAMAARGLAPKALVISESVESPVPVAETCASIARHLPAGLPIATLPRTAGHTGPWTAMPDLATWFEAIV